MRSTRHFHQIIANRAYILWTADVDGEVEFHKCSSSDVRRGPRLLPAAKSHGRSARRHLHIARQRHDHLFRPTGRP